MVKKVIYFGEFGYLNSSCLLERVLFSSFTVPWGINSRSVTYVFVGFRFRRLLQISINLGKEVLRISCIRKIAVTRILARGYIFIFFHFPDSGLHLLNGFDFYFDPFWMAWNWKPAIYDLISCAVSIRVSTCVHNHSMFMFNMHTYTRCSSR